MKKKLYLLCAVILIVSIISSFVMTALADETSGESTEESGEITVTETEKDEDDTTIEEPVSDPTTKKSEEKKKWSELSEEEQKKLIENFVGKTSDDVKKYLAENYDISEEDINNFVEKVKDKENWSRIAESLASLTTTKPTTTTAAKPTTTKASSSSKTTKSSKKVSTKKKSAIVATTLSEDEITTVAIEEEEEINVASLKNDEHGVAVYPDRSGGYSFNSGSFLSVMGVDATSTECTALVNASGVTVDDFIFLKDISVSGYDGQKVKIAFTVGEQYKGQIVTVLHYHNDEVETFVTKVSDDGLVVIAVDSLSPFAIMLGQPEVSAAQEAGLFGKIYEATGISKLAVILIICGVVVLAAIIVVVVVINNDKKKKWAESQNNLR